MVKRSRIDVGRVVEIVGDLVMLVASFVLFAAAFWGVLTMCGAAGCVAPGARQGTAEVDVSPIVEAVAELQATVELEATATAAVVADQSRRTVDAVRAKRDSYVDQSTADRWVNRAMAIALGLAVLTYPVGKIVCKIVWLVVGGVGRRFGNGRATTMTRIKTRG